MFSPTSSTVLVGSKNYILAGPISSRTKESLFLPLIECRDRKKSCALCVGDGFVVVDWGFVYSSNISPLGIVPCDQ